MQNEIHARLSFFAFTSAGIGAQMFCRMMPRPAIFISAVSSELKSARQLVANTLHFLGFAAVWQEVLRPEQGDLCEVLRRKIDGCAAVIQLVGRCYGVEPPVPDEEFGRVSYTQYEALYAQQRGKKVWYLLLDDSFPQDACPPEADEPARWQATYAAGVRAANRASRPSADMPALLAALFELGLKAGEVSPRLAQHVGPQPESATAQSVFDENVQFTVYRPTAMALGQWSTWLAFAHRGPGAAEEPDHAEEVERQARAVLGAKFDDYATGRQDSGAALPRESTISVVPSVEGLEFNPIQRSFVWQEPVHREDFRARAVTPAPQGIHRGRITFYLGALVVAEINVKVGATLTMPASATGASEGDLKVDRARAYRQIFASYSRRDTAIVEHFEKLVASFGDRYLRDVHALRAGEEWNASLERMIREADIFQLFWSSNSMRSRYVRQEWEYALSLGRPLFVRPTYWQKPIPEDRAANLPPEELRRIHFQHLPVAFPAEAGEVEGDPRRCEPITPAPDELTPTRILGRRPATAESPRGADSPEGMAQGIGLNAPPEAGANPKAVVPPHANEPTVVLGRPTEQVVRPVGRDEKESHDRSKAVERHLKSPGGAKSGNFPARAVPSSAPGATSLDGYELEGVTSHGRQLLLRLREASFRSRGGKLIFGSSAKRADVHLNDPTVAPIHAALKCENDKLFIEDQGTTGKTTVNGTALKPFVAWPVQMNDVVCLGKLRFRLKLAKSPGKGSPQILPPAMALTNFKPVGWVAIIDGGGSGHVLPLRAGQNSVGRRSGAAVHLDFGDVEITREAHCFIVYDEGSRSFTILRGRGRGVAYVNGQAVLGPRVLQSGDLIRIGATCLRLVPLCGPEFSWEPTR